MTEQMTGKMTEQMTDKERNEVETNQDASGQAVEAPKKKMSTVRLAKMGMLVAISVVLVYFIHFPIFRQFRLWSMTLQKSRSFSAHLPSDL